MNQREALKRDLRRYLRLTDVPDWYAKSEWLNAKLEAMMAVGLMDKSKLSERTLRMAREHFQNGRSIASVGWIEQIPRNVVKRELEQYLDAIIDSMPGGIRAALDYKRLHSGERFYETWRLNGCPRCGSALYYDPLPAYGREGEWCCLLCGRRESDSGELYYGQEPEKQIEEDRE